MPYRIAIPDTCDRKGCEPKEAVALISWATKMPEENVILPTPADPEIRYISEKDEILAEAEWYEEKRIFAGKGAKGK